MLDPNHRIIGFPVPKRAEQPESTAINLWAFEADKLVQISQGSQTVWVPYKDLNHLIGSLIYIDNEFVPEDSEGD